MRQETRQYGNEGRSVLVKDKVNVDAFSAAWLADSFAGGQKLPTKALMMSDRDGEDVFVANHSSGYRLVQNETVSQVVEDVMTRAEMPFRHVRTMWDGKRFMEQYRAPGTVIGTQDDRVELAIEGINSYDGSTQFGIRFLLLRLVCTNGLYASDRLGGFMFRHSEGGEFDLDDAIERLHRGSEQFMQMAPGVQAMMERSVDLADVLSFHRSLMEGSPKWNSSKTSNVLLAMEREEKPTLWHLVNAMTAVTSHEMNPLTSHRLSERIVAAALRIVEGEVIDVESALVPA